MEDIVQLYRDLHLQLDPDAGIYEKGISDEEIHNFEKEIDKELPDEFKAIYKQFNGESDNFPICIFSDYMFLSLENVAAAKDSLKDLPSRVHEMERYLCYPEHSIKKVAYNPYWIPFASTSSGSYIGIDLDPDVEGKIGQVINFGVDDFFHVQLAEDFRSFLIELKSGYSRGEYHTHYFKGSICIVDQYTIDHESAINEKYRSQK